MTAKVQDPRKKFNFGIAIPGLYPFFAQKVTLPDWEVEMDEHGDLNSIIKTGGILNMGKLSLEKIGPAIGPDNWLHFWILQVQDGLRGTGMLPSMYKRPINVYQYSVDGLTVLNTWFYYGAWPQIINGIELSRQDSGNTIESAEFCVDHPDYV